MKKLQNIFLLTVLLFIVVLGSGCFRQSQHLSPKPRILISTDIGGTDPDDNQSMTHLLMYSDLFDIEGIISSPSYGNGHVDTIYRMIELYRNDLPVLEEHSKNFPSPDYLRSICKQGRHGGAPFAGYTTATEGSDWIIKCAKKQSPQPLWVLVWGGIDDLAQALHDAPEIADKIRVYWIGGPNKKWSANSYAYIVENFPNLWIIENNASYRGFITNGRSSDRFDGGYYDEFMREAGYLGKDFINYLKGVIKMGDTPSLLYMMSGDPADPTKECWGGSFEQISRSSRIVYHLPTQLDTVPTYSVIELWLKGPLIDLPVGSPCFTLRIDRQNWNGYYLGNGDYAVRYSPKAPATLSYEIRSDIEGLNQNGVFVVSDPWPGKENENDYPLGSNWYTDKIDADLFENGWQGAKTVSKWRIEVLQDWGNRLKWLKE